MEFVSEYTNDEITKINDEFKRLKDNIYLDHAGTTLYSEQQLKDIYENFTTTLFSNPHTSKITEDIIDQVRYRILNGFNTTDNEYSIVFTAGATASLKMVAENFNFTSTNNPENNCSKDSSIADVKQTIGQFVYVKETHTSGLGMREIVNTTKINHISKTEFLTVSSSGSSSSSELSFPNHSNSLFLYPAQCNFNGFKYPLDKIEKIQQNGLNRNNNNNYNKSNWFVCLDAASYVSTNFLDLEKYRPDFVTISFYKMFGYPTGLGALLVSKRGQTVLQKKYYGGGTVKIALSEQNWHRKRDRFHERFEDGTLSFLSIASLLSGYNTIERLISTNSLLVVDDDKNKSKSMNRISKHCYNLAKYLYHHMKEMKHWNGQNVIKFYHSTTTAGRQFESIERQGGIINFNVLNSDGNYIGFAEISAMASLYNIHLRVGCFCNPGACQENLQLSNDDIMGQYNAGHVCGDLIDLVNGKPTGSVRVSFGYMTQKTDIDALIKMIQNTYIELSLPLIKTKQIIPRKIFPNDKLTQETITNIVDEIPVKIRLKEICVFPIKSCGPHKVKTRWPINNRGLKYDREWMIVQSNGVCLTQKILTKLCLIRPKIDIENGWLELNFPYASSIKIPLELSTNHKQLTNDNDPSKQFNLCHSKVCGDRIIGLDCGNDVADWLSDVLYIPNLRLIRQSVHDTRTFKSSKNNTNINVEDDQSISLANQAQYLLINSTSVEWLINKVDDWNYDGDIDDDDVVTRRELLLKNAIDRFRGNLIVETVDPLAEMYWQGLRFGKYLHLTAQGPCTRCQMICIDQTTGDKTREPLKTISREFQGKMKFGLYLGQTVKLGNISDDNEIFINCDEFVIAK